MIRANSIIILSALTTVEWDATEVHTFPKANMIWMISLLSSSKISGAKSLLSWTTWRRDANQDPHILYTNNQSVQFGPSRVNGLRTPGKWHSFRFNHAYLLITEALPPPPPTPTLSAAEYLNFAPPSLTYYIPLNIGKSLRCICLKCTEEY